MKKTNILGLSLVSILALTACGGGSSSSEDVTTGTAYYLDSAVAGINYKCGDQEGLTGTDGSFTFEEGKECTFYLGGIKLRDIDKSELTDGAKIVEEDIKIATLLQTLDADGNPENGITIKKEIVEAMATSLSEDGGDGTLPETATELEVLVASLEHVEGYSGHAVTQSAAQTHLDGTKTDITKALLTGKKFYIVGEEDGQTVMFEGTFNSTGTALDIVESDGTTESLVISIDSDKMIFTDDSDGSYALISEENGYIFADDRHADGSKDGIGHRLYTSQSDAQAYFDSVKGETNEALSETEKTKALLAGKTFYAYFIDHDNADTPTIGEIKFNNEVTSFIDKNGNVINAQVNANVITLSYPDGYTDVMTVTSDNDKYILLYEDEDDMFKLFYNEADAQAYYDSLSGGDDNTQTEAITQFSKEWLNRKTLYNVYHDCDDYDNRQCVDTTSPWEMSTFTFTETNMHGVDASGDSMDVSYTITSDGYISAQRPAEWDEGTGYFNIGIAERTDEYLKLCWSDPDGMESCLENGGDEEYFFFDQQTATSFLNQKN